MHTPCWSSPRYSPEMRAALHGAAVRRAAALRNHALDAAAAAAACWLRSAALRALRQLSTRARPSSTHSLKA